MLMLDVRVPANRNQAAIATLYAVRQVLKTGHAAASVARELAAQKGNPSCDMMRQWGNPAFGSYRLFGSTNVPECCRGEYGLVLLAFEPQSGVALDAESFGRLGLAVYAGAAGSDRRPRRTQGGLRISEEFMKLIRLRMATEAEIRVSLSPLVPPSFWQFWRRLPTPCPLSTDGPRFTAPPLDEATLLAEAMRHVVSRKPGIQRVACADTWRDDHDTQDNVFAENSPFQGKDGNFGGAGASGTWDVAMGAATGVRGGTTVLPPGVDAAGRILAASSNTALGIAGVDVLSGEMPGSMAPGNARGIEEYGSDAIDDSATAIASDAATAY
ncbi:MAG: hypothetical protein ABTS22_10105 [Accumulibacter sp.]|uniref:hypothetical protein n=1 Tax=Accumulibacter sp. TaxID=2053492 RepID=UPI003314DF0C